MKIFTNFFNSSPSSTHLQKKSANCKSKERPTSPSDALSSASSNSPISSGSFGKCTAAPPTPPSVILRPHPDDWSAPTELRPKITKEEWELVLRLLGNSGHLAAEEAAAILHEANGDGDCGINLSNFGALGSSTGGEGSVEEELKGAFRVFDSDGDGRISAEELLGVFLTLGDDGCTLEDCRRMIGGVTSRDDGFVCFDDFVRMMSGQIGL
ncbi:unnamed protein product [Spirodela intermedia]|uniref:EF-hand domain-containing protein n=1 Tax=Spirodela intermedia TaxID=51605 RepID=A0A7I8KL16_SPIIN|nr:unnamed protein product [Spirodela intermedia]